MALASDRPIPACRFWTVFKREVRHYAHSPSTYVAMSFFFLLAGALFALIVADFLELSQNIKKETLSTGDPVEANVTESVISQLFLVLNFIFIFVAPMLTMRLISEEKRSGTFELLVSTPLGNWDIILGKYCAALAVGLKILLLCLIYPIICSLYSDPEWPVVVSCFVGLGLILMAYTAFGLFASALSESQIAAGIFSFVGLLLFYMVGMLFKAGKLGLVGAALSLRQHSENFTRGIILLEDVAYFAFFSLFFLFMSAQILDARRWRA